MSDGTKRIAVFDFSSEDCARIAAAVREWYAEERSASVAEYTDIQPFVYGFKEMYDIGTPYDIVFVGVEDMMGMEIARNIREIDTWCPMFLVSSISDFAIEGFRLRALDYLTKPVSPGRVGEAVRRIGMNCQAGAQRP